MLRRVLTSSSAALSSAGRAGVASRLPMLTRPVASKVCLIFASPQLMTTSGKHRVYYLSKKVLYTKVLLDLAHFVVRSTFSLPVSISISVQLGIVSLQAGLAAAEDTVHRGEIVDGMRDYRIIDDVVDVVNRQITEDTYSRLFAVVFINGKQFKVVLAIVM